MHEQEVAFDGDQWPGREPRDQRVAVGGGKDRIDRIAAVRRAMSAGHRQQVEVVVAEDGGGGVAESHHLALPAATYGGGQSAAKHLALASVLLCGIGLPLPSVDSDLNGIRIGTQEITKFGVTESAMDEIARLMKRVMIDGEDPGSVRPDVIAFRKPYQHLAFVR